MRNPCGYRANCSLMIKKLRNNGISRFLLNVLGNYPCGRIIELRGQVVEVALQNKSELVMRSSHDLFSVKKLNFSKTHSILFQPHGQNPEFWIVIKEGTICPVNSTEFVGTHVDRDLRDRIAQLDKKLCK
ncbi:hypothetical protein JTB14_027853 [Gonioctena quinquepunctata]|nr:hypothetical protein JTB14_027853 [Gonioctena quinquepunctata]